MKKKLMIGIVIILILLMGSLITFVILNKDDSNVVNNNNNTSNEEENDIVQLDDWEEDVFNKLLEFAKEIQNNKLYTQFDMNEEGIYYVTLGDLRDKYNYDISDIKNENGELCNLDNTIISFDIDYKKVPSDSAYPFLISMDCK